jgi:hypothetical protein
MLLAACGAALALAHGGLPEAAGACGQPRAGADLAGPGLFAAWPGWPTPGARYGSGRDPARAWPFTPPCSSPGWRCSGRWTRWPNAARLAHGAAHAADRGGGAAGGAGAAAAAVARAAGPPADALWRRLHRLSRHPLRCALLHAAAIWFWHAPAPYIAAVQTPGWHVLEHACFLFTGWLFWWSVLRPGRAGVLPARWRCCSPSCTPGCWARC